MPLYSLTINLFQFERKLIIFFEFLNEEPFNNDLLTIISLCIIAFNNMKFKLR